MNDNVHEIQIEDQKSMAMDVYFETMLDNFSAPMRYVARKARETGPFIVRKGHFLAPHLTDMINGPQDDELVIRYREIVDIQPICRRRVGMDKPAVDLKVSFKLNF